MSQRFAIYYAPAVTDLLWDRASVWLGRDPATGLTYDGAVAGLERTRLLNLTQSAMVFTPRSSRQWRWLRASPKRICAPLCRKLQPNCSPYPWVG